MTPRTRRAITLLVLAGLVIAVAIVAFAGR